MNKIGIYKITNKKDGKVYIGQSVDIERRLKEHKKKKTITIDDYINIFGVENFDFEIIEECSEEELNKKEQFYIKQYDSNKEEKGYNLTAGGSNCAGESNGRSRMTEQDVVFIRTSYNEHKKQKEIFELFKDKITWSQFQAIWQGTSWCQVMPEVYTEENREWYKIKNSVGENSPSAVFSNKEVIDFREEYVLKTAKEIYNEHNLKSKIKFTTFQKILMGESYHLDIPVYKKTLRQWYLNGEPVSTISESGE